MKLYTVIGSKFGIVGDRKNNYRGSNVLFHNADSIKTSNRIWFNPFVHVAYRQVIGTLGIAPIAYIFERRTRPTLTNIFMFNRTKVVEVFDSPYTSTTLMFSMTSVKCIIVALCFEHRKSK